MAWAFIAHKQGKWSGVISGDEPAENVGKFLSEMVERGCSVKTAETEEEYLRALGERVK